MQVVYITLQRSVRVVRSAGQKAKFYEWHHVQVQMADGSWMKFFGSAASTLMQAVALADSIHN